MQVSTITYTLTGAGTEIPNFDVADTYEKYIIKGAATAIGNYAISLTGTPQQGTTFIIKYKGVLDITTNGTTFSILGQALTQNQLISDLDVEAYYDGSSWIIEIKPSFTSAVVEASNLTPNAVTAASIADDSITNAKLATMTASSLKYGDASGNPGDLAIGNNLLPIGDGTTITTISKSDLQNGIGSYDTIVIPVSFESGEQGLNRFYVNFSGKITQAMIMVTKAIAGTDDGTITLRINGTPITTGQFIVPASTAVNMIDTVIPSALNTFSATNFIEAATLKTTAGGKCLVTLIIERT